MKLGNDIFQQYWYHEQVISVIGRAKNFSDAEPIVQLARSRIGERIFKYLRSEIYIGSEGKTSKTDCFKVS